jgi:diacylglycerol kinase family enzyme
MQATLIFNENAGGNGNKELTPQRLQEALLEAGFFPIYQATQSEEELDGALRDAEGLIVAAGGDGTIRAVVTRLIGRKLPLAVLPMGTANNVARTLAIEGSPLDVIAGLKQPRIGRFDVGHVQAPWGEDYFLEGAGFGFFADILTTYEPEKGKSIFRGLQAFTNTVREGQTYPNTLWFDGETASGAYLLVELLNTKAVGPRLQLAPDADPDDGLLDLVYIEESDREGFLQYAGSLLTEDLDKLQTVTTRKVREIKFRWDGFPFHVDAETRPPGIRQNQASEENESSSWSFASSLDPGEVTIRILPAAVELWLPTLPNEVSEK